MIVLIIYVYNNILKNKSDFNVYIIIIIEIKEIIKLTSKGETQ